MKNKKLLLYVLGPPLLAFLAWRVCMPVDATEYAIKTRFGKVIGQPIHEPGLHFKWPWDTRITLDKRLRIFDPRPSEFLLVSKASSEEAQGIGQNVIVDYFATWRVLGPGAGPEAAEAPRDGPLRFLKSVNNPLNAEAKLLEILHSEVSKVLGQHDMSALVSMDPDDLKLAEIEAQVTEAGRAIAARDFGIAIEDVRIKRVGLPEQNKQSVFERMRAERMRKATKLRAEGQRDALRIKAEADKEASRILAESYREAELIRGEGDAEATRVYADAHNRDPEFYRFVRTLEAYKKFLNDKTTVVLSTDSELLQLLTGGAPIPSPSQPRRKQRPDSDWMTKEKE